MNKFKLLFALTAGIAFSLPVSAKMYKWVDNQGITHYGETIPPEYADKSRQILDKSGEVIKTQHILTPDERRAQEAEAAKEKASETTARDQKRYDTSLTDTYSNVSEIELSRSRSIQQVDARISSINSQLKMANDNLADAQKYAAARGKRDGKIPKFVQDEVKAAQDRVISLQQDLNKSKADRQAVEARFDADKARYKELTGQ